MSDSIVKTVIEILDKDLNKVAEVHNPYPLNANNDILQYSKELSDFGQCKFRVSAFDPLLTTFGDILQPHKYHVRIRRAGMVVWQGAIAENTKRNKSYIEVIAVQYIWYLGKKLIHRTSTDANGTANIYRVFNSGTMATAVTALINETITDYQGEHVLAGMTIGTIENPNFPPNTTDGNGNVLAGSWIFSSNLSLQFDFHTVLYVLKSFGIYSYADFEIDNNLVFNFKRFIGNDHHYDINFAYGPHSRNVIDYNLPRFGQRMVNKLTGIATDENGVILHYDQTDEASVGNFGLIEGVAAFSDVKSQSILDARIQAELPLISTPDETNAIVVLNEKGYPLGQYDVGDIVNIQVENKGVDFNDVRRIVGITVVLNGTGREVTTVQSNRPLPWQYGSSGSAQ